MALKKQHAALPYVVIDGTVRVLLLTSRETKRWIIPKGWPKKGMAANELAALEAYEEAGIKGRVSQHPIGDYHYVKGLKAHKEGFCRVDVYPLLVETHLLDWPEKGQREQLWTSPEKASTLVQEQELSWILKSFTPEETVCPSIQQPKPGLSAWFKRLMGAR